MRKFLLKHFLSLIAFLFGTVLFAQITVSGVVSDDLGPIPGVSIIEKGTNNGTTTGLNGEYTIKVSDNATLVFSFLGLKTTEVVVGEQTEINVTLEEDAAKLDEIVVVGYGTTTRRDQTGAVESISAKDLNKGVQTNATDLLQGRSAGVQVTTAGGEPGSAATIRVRGGASLRAGNDPLYVVDGMLINANNPSAGTGDIGFGTSSDRNPLNFINPNDIENISILKDASATAIYGSRGANGVIIITTKKGKFGEPKITLNTTFATARIANKVSLLDGNGFRNALSVEGLGSANDLGGNVDAIDAITETALTASYNISIVGGNEKSQYRYSLSALDQDGIIIDTNIKNYSASVSNTYKFFDDKLKLDANLITSYVKDTRQPITNDADFEGNLIGAALFWNPTVPLRNNDGTIRQRQAGLFDSTGQALSVNPLAVANFTNIGEESSRIVGNIAATFTIIKGLDYKFNFGVDRSESNSRSSASRNLDREGVFDLGLASSANRILFSHLIEHTLNYKTQIGANVSLDALVGYGFQEFSNRGFSAFGSNISIDPGNGSNFLDGFVNRNISSFKAPSEELESYFGRAVVSFYDKYSLTATFRADGSNKFGANNEWGYFPAFAAAWKIDQEDFSPDFFDQLKLRVSWGQSGNQGFPPGSADDRFRLTNQGGQTGAVNITAANPNLSWEVNTTVNVGVDFAILNNRLSGSIDIFQRDTDDLIIIDQPIQPAPPGVNIWRNLPDANVQNQGIELTLFGDIVKTADWSFSLGGNFSLLRNELEDLERSFLTGAVRGQGLSGNFSQLNSSGQPINSFFMPVFAGIDASGNPQFFDANNNLTTDASGTAERRFVGDPNPNLLIGLNANVSYRNWDMQVNMNGAYGHQIYNNTANVLSKNNLTARNMLPSLVGNGEDPSAPNAVSTRYLESGDFLRLNNLTVGYSFKGTDLPKYVETLRVALTGQNLFVITPYSGFDPEVNTDATINGVPSFGIDYLAFPRARTFSVGLFASF